MASSVSVAVIGVSGYSGSELARLLCSHPAFRLAHVFSDRWQGQPLSERLRLPAWSDSLVVQPMTQVAALTSAAASVVLLATPHEVSARLAPQLLDQGLRVIDLSGAFRLRDPMLYPSWYGFSHPAPALLAEAYYGLPEVSQAAAGAPALKDARLVANPGCYATAAILALAPLLHAGLVQPTGLFLDGKSGVTGAGRKVEERLMFPEVCENLTPYRIGTHQHVPEIEQALTRVAGAPVSITFVPHLIPVRRGLLVTAYGQLLEGRRSEEVQEATAAFYAKCPHVEVVAPAKISFANVVGWNGAMVSVHADAQRRSLVSLGALDNLLKGAAAQALQNLCSMVGVEDIL